MPWYIYTSGDPSVNTHYVSAGTGIPDCIGECTLCAIYTQPGGAGRPLISEGIYFAAQIAFFGVIIEGVTLLKECT